MAQQHGMKAGALVLVHEHVDLCVSVLDWTNPVTHNTRIDALQLIK